jgi:hypothetical protein
LNCSQPLLAGAFILSALSSASLATIVLMQHNGYEVPSWMPVVAIATFVWGYAAGILPVTYVVLSEIFNFQVSDKVTK